MAKGSYFSPSAAAIVKLVERLRAERWITPPTASDTSKLRFGGAREERARTTGGYAAQTVANTFGEDRIAKLAANITPLPVVITTDWRDDGDREELRLVWPVAGEGLPLNYPLSHRPEAKVSYALELHRAHDYVYPTSKTIGELATDCRCGEDLSFGWDEEEVVPAFDRSTGIYAECQECSRTFDPSQGTAIITNPFDRTRQEVRGGAAYRFAVKIDCGTSFVADPGITFAQELVSLIEGEFGRDFYEVGATYELQEEA